MKLLINFVLAFCLILSANCAPTTTETPLTVGETAASFLVELTLSTEGPSTETSSSSDLQLTSETASSSMASTEVTSELSTEGTEISFTLESSSEIVETSSEVPSSSSETSSMETSTPSETSVETSSTPSRQSRSFETTTSESSQPETTSSSSLNPNQIMITEVVNSASNSAPPALASPDLKVFIISSETENSPTTTAADDVPLPVVNESPATTLAPPEIKHDEE